MKISSHFFGCLLLALFAMLFLVSCPKKSSTVPNAWIYLKGRKISLRDKFNVLDKRYNFSVCPDCYDPDMRIGYYFTMPNPHPDSDASSCTLWVIYDHWTHKILSINVSYLFWRKITQKDLKQLSKEVYFDKFKKLTKPFSKTRGGAHYAIKVDNGSYGVFPTVEYTLTWMDN